MKQLFCLILFVFATHLSAQEICNNGIDDDGDGFIDLNDSMDCRCGAGTPLSVASLIPNPSFEQRTCCPSSLGQFCVTDWGSVESSDYFNNNCVFVPIAFASTGVTNYPDGAGCVGTVLTSDYKEYITSCLTSPMLAGVSYILKFNTVSLLTDPYMHDAVCGPNNNYGAVDLTMYGKVNCSNLSSISGGPNTCISVADTSWKVLGSVSYTPSLNWSLESITFTPSMNINAIAFGGPCTLPASYLPYDESNSGCIPYFMFDNLRLSTSNNTSFVDVTSTGHYCTNNLVLKSQLVNSVSSGATVQWFRNGIALVGATSLTYSVPSGTIGNYQLMVTNGNFCGLSHNFNVTAAAPTIAVYSPTICNSSSYTLLATSPVINTYTWSTGATTNTILVSPNTTAVYTVSGTYGNCISQTTPTVTVIYGTSNPLYITASIPSACPGASVVLTPHNNGSGNYWSHDPMLPSSTQSVIVKPNSTTSYSLTSVYQNPTASNCVATAVITVSVISTTMSVSPNNISICPGRPVTLLASGNGISSYTWSNGANTNTTIVTPTVNTTFTVAGTDGVCTISATTLIRPDSTISVSIANNDYSCIGSPTTLYGYGATSYTWSNGITGTLTVVSPTTATTYSVIGSQGYCTAQAGITVNVIDPLLFSVTANTLICLGQSSTFMSPPPPSPFAVSYKMLNGPGPSTVYVHFPTYVVTPTVTSTYTMTTYIQNASCTPKSVITVSVIPRPTVTVSPTSTTLCIGDNVTLVAAGSGNFSWSNNSTANSITVSPITNMVYSVSVSNTACSASANSTVTVNELPIVSFDETPVLCVTNDPIALSASPINGTFSGTGVVSNAMFDPFISGIGTFPLSYSYTDMNGCSNTASQTAIVSACTGISELEKSEILICPNPTNSVLYISGAPEFTNIKIMNAIGQTICIYQSIPDVISVSDFANGIYFIQLLDQKATAIKTKKFIKN